MYACEFYHYPLFLFSILFCMFQGNVYRILTNYHNYYVISSIPVISVNNANDTDGSSIKKI